MAKTPKKPIEVSPEFWEKQLKAYKLGTERARLGYNPDARPGFSTRTVPLGAKHERMLESDLGERETRTFLAEIAEFASEEQAVGSLSAAWQREIELVSLFADILFTQGELTDSQRAEAKKAILEEALMKTKARQMPFDGRLESVSLDPGMQSELGSVEELKRRYKTGEIYVHIGGNQIIVTEHLIPPDEPDEPGSEEIDGHWEGTTWKRGPQESE